MVARRSDVTGSTLRVRGKVRGLRVRGWTWGLNPTYAGKTERSQAQPHTRGESQKLRFLMVTFSGSTPHARGRSSLTRRYACKMPESYSLSLCGVSRRCPPTETFAPCSGCSGLDVHHWRVTHPFIKLSPCRRRACIYSSTTLLGVRHRFHRYRKRGDLVPIAGVRAPLFACPTLFRGCSASGRGGCVVPRLSLR